MQPDNFEEVVSQYYEALYKFAMSLTGAEADACDLTQQTFYVWATKGGQLRDRGKVKSWLFTTLYREFLRMHKKSARFQHDELTEEQLPVISPTMVNELDAATVVKLLAHLAEPYRAAVSLFYLEEHSYKEIAEILGVPMGTVRSRLSRGLEQLQELIVADRRAKECPSRN
jgi:RNA polymerase sigma-70 factor (ECF subfamily)